MRSSHHKEGSSAQRPSKKEKSLTTKLNELRVVRSNLCKIGGGYVLRNPKLALGDEDPRAQRPIQQQQSQNTQRNERRPTSNDNDRHSDPPRTSQRGSGRDRPSPSQNRPTRPNTSLRRYYIGWPGVGEQ